MRPHGQDTVHWAFSASDANAVKSVPVYDKDGATITPDANDQFFITSYKLQVGATGMRADLFIDHNGDGLVTANEMLAGGDYAANGGEGMDIATNPRPLPKGGNILKVLTGSAAGVVVIAHGYRRRT
jgi:hypothetical protein